MTLHFINKNSSAFFNFNNLANKCDEMVEITIWLEQILAYSGGITQSFTEGDALYKDKHVVSAGVVKKNEEETIIYGLVVKALDSMNIPYEVYLKLPEDVCEWECECSCDDNSGQCKHILALLIYLHDCDELPAAAADVIKEVWDTAKEPVKEVEGCRLSELCCFPKPKVPEYKTTPEMDAMNFERLLAAAPNSALAMHVKNYRRATRDPLATKTQSGSSNYKKFKY